MFGLHAVVRGHARSLPRARFEAVSLCQAAPEQGDIAGASWVGLRGCPFVSSAYGCRGGGHTRCKGRRSLPREESMHRSALVLGMLAGVVSLGVIGEREARACGGCFHPPTQTAADITDERMLLSVSTMQSTLYDQIRYSGSPTSFAWVLPIHGTVDVGLSADVLFDSVDTLTATQMIPPEQNCPSQG